MIKIYSVNDGNSTILFNGKISISFENLNELLNEKNEIYLVMNSNNSAFICDESERYVLYMSENLIMVHDRLYDEEETINNDISLNDFINETNAELQLSIFLK